MKDFVDFSLAEKLKEKGFDLETEKVYLKGQYNIPCPTIAQVLKWLRHKHKLHIEFVANACGYIYIISDTPSEGGTDRYSSDYDGPNDGGAWDNFEECALAGIRFTIDNLI